MELRTTFSFARDGRMRYGCDTMSKASTNFKDLGPILIVIVVVIFAYMVIREQLNWNRDRINEQAGAQAKLQRQVNDLERSLVGLRNIPPPMPTTQTPIPSNVGDISFSNNTVDSPKARADIAQWLKLLNPKYEALKLKHKPSTGRSIVLRVIFGADRKVERADFIKSPLNPKLGSALVSVIRGCDFPKSETKTAKLSLQINFDP
jgi:hypothetical protein